ncbi:MAG: extensin family protein [Solirubrobacterales bacterium]
MSARRLLAIVMLAALAGCAQPPPKVAAPPQPQIVDPDTACLQELSRLQASFEPLQSFGDEDAGCRIANPVRVSQATIPWSRPGTLSCSMARTLAHFEAEVIQPAAQQRFGQPVKRILHAGTYDCRYRRNGSTKVAAGSGGIKGGRLSEHAHGLAIDITGFELADGSRVTVAKDWRGAGERSAFLQQVARSSCSTFNVVLTPNHDRLHQDHLHLDIGPYTLCGY